MINRQNWKDTQAFLNYQKKIFQNHEDTLIRHRTNLRHLLEWADSASLERARAIEPTFQVYLASKTSQIKNTPLAPATLTKILQAARQFFIFARREWPDRYKSVPESWIVTLQPSRARGLQSRIKSHAHYAVEDIQKIAALYSKAETLRERRDIAATCFIFLSGMRIDAFCSLPISCVDLQSSQVMQLPEKGVRTKNSKAAVTYIFTNLEDLLAVVKDWDKLVRSKLSKDDLWFPVMDHDGNRFEKGRKANKNRGNAFADNLEILCAAAGVDYQSPHKLRHGHAVYALKSVKDMAGLKAVSQNLMHESVTITDAVYGGLSGEDVAKIYANIGGSKDEKTATPQLDQQAMQELFSNPAFIAFIESIKSKP